jgi:hypothetical protein
MDKSKASKAADTEALRAEVKAFASSLGFSSLTAGFDYDDFAPEKAAKKIQPSAEKQQQQQQQQAQQPQQQQKHHLSGKQVQQSQGNQQSKHNHQHHQQNQHQKEQQRQPGKQHLKGQQQQQQQQQRHQHQPHSKQANNKHPEQQPQERDPIKERIWVDSVGPRPGGGGWGQVSADNNAVWLSLCCNKLCACQPADIVAGKNHTHV